MNRLFFLFLISALFLPAASAPGPLLPIGGGYSDIYAGFSQAAVANAKDNQVNILILASTYSTNPLQITEAERATNLRDANERRFQIEEACKRAAPPEVTCAAVLAPIFTRADAEDPSHLDLFSDDLAAIFILGGDQTVGMQVIIGTPVEKRLEELHNNGVIVGGTSAGGGMQSRAMLAGYNLNYAAETSLFWGAVDVWNMPEKHGLTFGLQNAILDQHFYQRARFGRLLNAILQPGVPHVGVGVDAYTGVTANDEVLGGVFGLYTVTILDAETYHAADSVRYVTIEPNRPPILSVRNVVVNLLSPGDATYDLKTRTSSLASPAPVLDRAFESLAVPTGAGALILGGDISDTLEDSPILEQFKKLAGDKILIVATGYPSARSAETAAAKYAEGLGVAHQVFVLDDTPLEIPSDVTAVLVIGKDQSTLNVAALAPLKDFWLAGKPVMTDNAASAVIGAFYSAHEPTPNDSEEAELATQKSFWQGKTRLEPGLGLLNITIEPQILADNRFGRVFSLAFNHPDFLTIGLNKDTAILFGADGATVIGGNGIFVFDSRHARTELGSNDGFVIANAMLDVFVPGEIIRPEKADINARFDPAPTPVLPTAVPITTPTLAPTPTQPVTPTIPALTATPAAEPPEQEASASPTFFFIGLLVVIVIVLFWFSRKRK